MKLLFLPFSIVAGFVAGFISKKLFEGIWQLVDREEAPDAEHREISIFKLVLALALEGAIFRAVRGVTDHQARKAFYRTTGRWPGEEAPEQA